MRRDAIKSHSHLSILDWEFKALIKYLSPVSVVLGLLIFTIFIK